MFKLVAEILNIFATLFIIFEFPI